MEADPQIPPDAAEAQHTIGSLDAELPKRARTRQGKVRLLQRDRLDQRTAAFKEFERLEAAILNDLGGRDALSEIELCLVEGFCGASVMLKNINARMTLGHAIEVTDLAQTISSMVRVASRLGEQRRARDVTARPSSSHSPLRGDLIEAGRTPS